MNTRPQYMANAFDGRVHGRLDPATEKLHARRERVLASSYRLFYSRPVTLTRGEGVLLFDAEGNEYLDAYNNVPAVGHSHPHVQRLVSAQLGMLNTHTRYLTEPVVAYSERLLSLFPQELSRVVYTCTGSEAVDLALRVARYETGAGGVICTSHSYHGTTSAAAEISPSLGPNNDIGSNVVLVDAPDLYREDPATAAEDFADRVRQAIDTLRQRGIGLAAVIVDSVMSSDGVQTRQTGQTGLLAPAADVVREAGGMWIADEVQSGFGRLGSGWWGFTRHGLRPDLVVLGKPMGNGIPIGALVGTEAAMDRFGGDVRYFNTFGGNSVSIAAATAVLDVVEGDQLIAHAREVGQHLITGLRELAGRHPGIGDVRGDGLFVAVEFVADPDLKSPDAATASAVVNELRERRILISSSGRHENVLKIRPPLPFAVRHADRLLTGIDDILSC
ncbi:aspartate aminotransferase family protein [Streptomyces sp. NPDC004609]|uniref:aspartate aminotransferase family protein n=1 Tax=Streptomyces sp. NPDC004609 TaxID=3364704 RepID=UPI0036A225AB